MNDEELFRIVKTAYPAALRVRHGIKVIAAAVAAAERERLLAELRTMHAQQNGRHNYYLHAAERLAGNR